MSSGGNRPEDLDKPIEALLAPLLFHKGRSVRLCKEIMTLKGKLASDRPELQRCGLRRITGIHQEPYGWYMAIEVDGRAGG